MNKELIIKQTTGYVRENLKKEPTGHDFWHVQRVLKMALKIAKGEKGVDLFVIQLAALLHDIADWKFHKGDELIGPKLAREWLEKMKVEENIISQVCEIIKDIPFKGALVKSRMKTKEGMIVQDADRLDVLGAIGIARIFAYGGKVGRPIHDPTVPPMMHKSFEEYKKYGNSSSINHFYEKILLLKDLMNTKTAKKIAQERHKFIKQFLDRFFKEWEGKD